MLNDPAFKPVFFPGAKTEEKLIDAFFEKNKGNALKKKPMVSLRLSSASWCFSRPY